MKQATKSFHDRIAVVFDFDKTLAPSSYDTLLEGVGLSPDEFREREVQPLSDAGWDDTLARVYTLVEASRSRDDGKITRARLAEIGQGIRPYDGVPQMFGRVREAVAAITPTTEVEFYLLSCGFVDVHRATSFADEFTAMWGTELHFDEDGEVAFARRMITFPEKVQYVMALSKGLPTDGPNSPADVWREVADSEIHVPLSQIVYLGDGGSDMPVFSLLEDHGGLAIGVFESETAEGWAGHSGIRAERRVQNLAAADYREDSELMRSLVLAVESVAKLIELRRLGQGE